MVTKKKAAKRKAAKKKTTKKKTTKRTNDRRLASQPLPKECLESALERADELEGLFSRTCRELNVWREWARRLVGQDPNVTIIGQDPDLRRMIAARRDATNLPHGDISSPGWFVSEHQETLTISPNCCVHLSRSIRWTSQGVTEDNGYLATVTLNNHVIAYEPLKGVDLDDLRRQARAVLTKIGQTLMADPSALQPKDEPDETTPDAEAPVEPDNHDD